MCPCSSGPGTFFSASFQLNGIHSTAEYQSFARYSKWNLTNVNTTVTYCVNFYALWLMRTSMPKTFFTLYLPGTPLLDNYGLWNIVHVSLKQKGSISLGRGIDHHILRHLLQERQHLSCYFFLSHFMMSQLELLLNYGRKISRETKTCDGGKLFCNIL